MQMNFHGRKRELAILEKGYQGERSVFIPIYGRRRVGKSELILKFMADRPGIYFCGKQAPSEPQIREFLGTAARALNEPLLANVLVDNWGEALKLIVSRWNQKGKLIIALDEFQWIAESSPELISVLQELWDRHWARSGKVMLIVCGSYLGFMEREVLGKKSPLFGRRTAQIQLRPFNHLEAAEFHPHYSIVDQARTYAICGGVPMYLSMFDDRVSVEQNIANCLLEETAPLAREPEFLLREELRDLSSYHAIMLALADGKCSPKEIANTTGIEVRAQHYYLQTLIQLGYAQRRHPLASGRIKIRDVRYRLDDPLLRFWFRFVFPHQSLIRSLGPLAGFAEIVRPGLDAYMGQCFERLCRECLPMLYLRESVRSGFEIGEFWNKQVQVDIVGVREDGWTDLGECKWGKAGSIKSLSAELEEKVGQYPNQRNATIGRRLFVQSIGPHRAESPTQHHYKIHTLKDLYNLKS